MKDMTLEKAVAVLEDIATAVKRWGKQASVPYRMAEILQAISLVKEADLLTSQSAQEVTKLRRQLAAANARVARLSGRTMKSA